MKGRTGLIFIIVLLSIAIGNYIRINQDQNLRAVEFLSILAIGILLGIFLVLIFKLIGKSNSSQEKDKS